MVRLRTASNSTFDQEAWNIWFQAFFRIESLPRRKANRQPLLSRLRIDREPGAREPGTTLPSATRYLASGNGVEHATRLLDVYTDRVGDYGPSALYRRCRNTSAVLPPEEGYRHGAIAPVGDPRSLSSADDQSGTGNIVAAMVSRTVTRAPGSVRLNVENL